MLVMRQRLEITSADGRRIFPYIVQATLEADRSSPIAELRVILPAYKGFDPRVLKPDDKVIWRAGYKNFHPKDEELPVEFEGVIVEVGQPNGDKQTSNADRLLKREGAYGAAAGRKIEIIARDPLHTAKYKRLKQSFLSGSPDTVFYSHWQEVTGLETAIRYNRGEVNRSGNIRIGSYGKSALWVIWRLTKVFEDGLGVDVYYRNGKVVLRDPGDQDYLEEKRIPVVVAGKNLVRNGLVLKPGRDVGVRVQGFNPNEDRGGEYFDVKYPDPKRRPIELKFERLRLRNANLTDSDLLQRIENYDYLDFDLDNCRSEQDAVSRAREIHQQIAGNGFTGSLTTFGFPRVLTSNPILIVDPASRENSMLCVVDKVRKTFDVARATFMQEVWPGNEPTRIINGLTVNAEAAAPGSVGSTKSTAIESGGYSALDEAASFLRGVFTE